jgi:hypothetical protein
MKLRIIKLEACIRDNKEVQEATSVTEKRIKGLVREVESEKQRADGNYKVLTAVNASLAKAQVYERELEGAFRSLEGAFRSLTMEFSDAVGTDPVTKMPVKGVAVMDG